MGTGNPIAIVPPASLAAFYVRLDARGPDGMAEPAMLRLQADAVGVNPVAELELSSGVALPASVDKSQAIQLRSRVFGGAPPEEINTFFATAGAFSPWHTLGSNAATWHVPDLPGPVTVTVVVRDGAGGVGWHTATVEVLP